MARDTVFWEHSRRKLHWPAGSAPQPAVVPAHPWYFYSRILPLWKSDSVNSPAPQAIETALQQLLDGCDLSPELMQSCFSLIMDGEATPVQIAALLTALRMKGECAAEIIGAARAMRERVTPIPTDRTGLLDTCGTGGDGLATFNISTATAIVAAAAGVPVAKHGNRSVSSSSGSADVLEALGVTVMLSPEQVARCVDEVGIGFCFAPLLHGAMKHAAPVRRELGFRTVFNLLGPLTNPAGAERQLLGTGRPDHAAMLAQALAELGSQRSIVVSGDRGLDEVCLWGPTQAFVVAAGQVSREEWLPEDFGLPHCSPDQLRVDGPAASARVVTAVLDGTDGPPLHMVLANTAAALRLADAVPSLQEGVALARETILSGRARTTLASLCELTASLADG